MNKLIEFNVPNGTIFVESQETATGAVVRGSGLSRITEKAGESLPQALTVIRSLADAAMAACSGIAPAPDTVELEFGLKFEAELAVVVAKSSAEGSLHIKMLWKPG